LFYFQKNVLGIIQALECKKHLQSTLTTKIKNIGKQKKENIIQTVSLPAVTNLHRLSTVVCA
jgi:hypothetical protein